MIPCVYNEKIMIFDSDGQKSIPRQVQCKGNPNNRKCDRCGWNPAVEAKRRDIPLTPGLVQVDHLDMKGEKVVWSETLMLKYKHLGENSNDPDIS